MIGDGEVKDAGEYGGEFWRWRWGRAIRGREMRCDDMRVGVGAEM